MDGSVGLQVRGSRQSSAVMQYSVDTNASEIPSELVSSCSPPYLCYGFRPVLLSQSLSQSLSLLLDTIDRNLMAGGGGGDCQTISQAWGCQKTGNNRKYNFTGKTGNSRNYTAHTNRSQHRGKIFPASSGVSQAREYSEGGSKRQSPTDDEHIAADQDFAAADGLQQDQNLQRWL